MHRRCQPYEKFLAWARTVPYTLRNPLYHWTHLELQRYFGITELLDADSAPRIWDQANSILEDGLDVHASCASSTCKPSEPPTIPPIPSISQADCRVILANPRVPTFRPDAGAARSSAGGFQ
jgi:glucuronate isomerase